MTAIVQPTLRPHQPIPGRPSLRVIEGGRSPRQLAQYRRRRIAVAIVLVAIATVTVIGVRAAVPDLSPTVPGAHPTAPVGLGEASGVPSVVVRPGDTLWSIARRVEPGGDVRAVVDRLADVHGTGPLQVGERLPIAAAKGG